MRILTILLLAAVVVFTPSAIVTADDGPGARCCGHMCPVAKAATTVGYEVVSELALVRMDEEELLA